MKRSQIQRTEFQRKLSHKGLRPSSKRLGKGKKTREWDSTRAKDLKPAFKRAGIETCEANYKDCMRDNGLTFAHSRKRRFITTDAEMREVALVCINCHRILDEKMSHAEMADAVRGMIAKRACQIDSCK